MYIPCATCKDRGCCADEEIMHREAIFAEVNGACLECPDWREDSYHGVAGVVNAVRLGSGDNFRGVRHSAGRYGVGAPLFLGAR